MLHPTPVFSVITVCFNAAATLEKTIQSVIAQTYLHVEYILVDGGSTDGSLAIIDKYRDRIAHVISEPDRGIYDAMNKGIRTATGDYLCFLNAGDCFHKEDILQQVAGRLSPDHPLPDVIYGETAIVDAGGNFLRMRRLSAPEELTWKSFRHGMLVCHQAFFARRTEELPEFDLAYRFSADYDWCIRIMRQTGRFHNTRLTLVNYLNEGATTRNHMASLRERFRIMARHYGFFQAAGLHLWFVIRAVVKP